MDSHSYFVWKLEMTGGPMSGLVMAVHLGVDK